MKPKGKNFIPAAVTLLILALPLSAWAAPRPSHPPQRPRPHHHQRHCPPPRPMVRHCPPPVIHSHPAPVYHCPPPVYYGPPPVYHCPPPPPPPPPPGATIVYRGNPWSFIFSF